MAIAGHETVKSLLAACSLDVAFTAFDSRYPPPISAYKYMERLRTMLELSRGQCFLAGFYLERYRLAEPSPLAFSAVHRLLGIASVLAHKFDSDFPFSDRTYAAVVGVTTSELMRLQILFLKRIDYRLIYPERCLSVWGSRDEAGRESPASMGYPGALEQNARR